MDEITNSRMLDMKDYAEKVILFLGNFSYDEFTQDMRTNLVGTRCIEIIGEAASIVPDRDKAEFPDIEWKEIIGIRIVLAYANMRIRLRTVYDIVQNDLPALIAQPNKLLDAKNDHNT